MSWTNTKGVRQWFNGFVIVRCTSYTWYLQTAQQDYPLFISTISLVSTVCTEQPTTSTCKWRHLCAILQSQLQLSTMARLLRHSGRPVNGRPSPRPALSSPRSPVRERLLQSTSRARRFRLPPPVPLTGPLVQHPPPSHSTPSLIPDRLCTCIGLTFF